MSVQVTIEFPEDVFSALRRDPQSFAAELRLAAAIKWYELGTVSQSKAAEIAGLSRHDFLPALGRYRVTPFQVTAEELTQKAAE